MSSAWQPSPNLGGARLVGVCAAIAVCFLLTLPAAGAEAGVIVSLGDSYSSGEGSGGYDRETSRVGLNRCHRSGKAWPRVLGVAKDHHLACSGAKMAHLSEGKTRAGNDTVGQAVRLAALATEVDIDTVVMTLGGNDADFGGKIRACRFGNCLRDLDALDRDLAALRPRLADAYRRVAAAAPGARLAVVGYPDIVPTPREGFRNCGWITDREKVRINHLQAELDLTLRGAAADAGVSYLPIRNVLDGHELCTKDSWVRPITSLSGNEEIQEMGHPDRWGQLAIAVRVRRLLRRLELDAAPGCVPASRVGVIVDDSESMSDNDPGGIRRRALELLLTKPASQGRTLGAVEFGTEAAALFAPGAVAANQSGMLAALGALADDGDPSGGGGSTNYNAAFEASRATHADAQARIFLTDGQHNEGAYEDAHLGGPPTYVIGLNIGPEGRGEDDADLLGRIAGDTGGRYFPLKQSADDDTEAQVARLQPVMNRIDSLLDCHPIATQRSQTFTGQGQLGGTVTGDFRGRPALEVVTSWGTLGVDIDLVRGKALDRRGRVLATLTGKGKPRRLLVNVVEGGTFDTITIKRPRRASKVKMRFRAVALPFPTPVSYQLRPIDAPAPQPGLTPVPDPAPGPGPTGPPSNTPPPAPARRVLTVDNRVTNGMGMREDSAPARLTTQPWTHCTSRGCNIYGTERSSGGTYDAAVCQTTGERTTNGHDSSASDDANPELFSSSRYYGVRLTNGTFGYVSEVWIRAADRGGLGLPQC